MIRIEHTSNPLNYGTNMMVTNFMYYLDKFSNVINEYNIDVFNDGDLNNYKTQYKEGNIHRQTIDYELIYSNNIFEKISNKIKRKIAFDYFYNKKVNYLKSTTDMLVILGGDDLSEYYGVENLVRELTRIENIKGSTKTYLIGQTIGPFYEERIDLAKDALKSLPIYSRDPWTTNYTTNVLGLNEVYDSSDLAFLPLPYQDDKIIESLILNKYTLGKEKYITIVPSGLYESYCKDLNVYLDNWVKIIEYVQQCQPTLKIVLLPHVLRYPMYDDRNIIKELEKRLGHKSNICYIYDEMMPLQARFILGNGIFTITGRMHGAISTFQMRKPAISISYSVKYDGVIGEGLGLSELIVKGDQENYWKEYDVQKETIDKIRELLNNYDSILEKISRVVDIAEEKARSMMKDISIKLIKDGGKHEK